MGFLKPGLPQVDREQWHQGSRSERIKPMAIHIAERGMGNPEVFYVLYTLKIALYILGGICFALATRGIDGWSRIDHWWHEPIVFQKIVLWTLLFEVLGFGCGFGPLTGKIAPPMGSVLYWLRPGTIRLAPWPTRVPFTGGDRRTRFDVALYAALLAATLLALLSDGAGPVPSLGTSVGVIAPWKIAVILAILGLLGLRDKTVFLAARGEVYGALALTFLFSGPNMIVGAKLVMLAIWIGAATSKLNRHFPFVVSTMMANNPLVRPKWLKRLFFRAFPDDLRPSWIPRWLAHGGTVIEMGVPVLLYFSHGGIITAIAATVMVVFHLVILTAIPLGVPLEWNVFMIFAVVTLFVDKAAIGWHEVTQPWPIAALMSVIVITVVVGNLCPAKVSFLPGMRYYAGNWDNSQWFFTEEASRKIAEHRVGLGLIQHKQLEKLSGPDGAQVALHLGYAFRAMFAHGRALLTLWDHVIPAGREKDYTVIDGETVAGYAIGWSFGDGHLHNEQLVAALQQRCHFAPGELRVLMLDGQAIQHQWQEYRIVDAATGELERGTFRVADVVDRQPWDHDVPITVTRTQDGPISAECSGPIQGEPHPS
ncbi:DUF3556 domain-containing protein [Mycolicibacterium farcinogenes]|uniref:DUF3556 domain-containing protein n=1 Tax=Mycolicibacterium farcinogenes TaxID=1802 RepID=UPI001C8F0B54|nr:DUF3556 domain-containing protein [Mycolicibacterium farcinogenes]QZH58417.1 DUF3556 domain-containing protein [Mycolicibacterium farcinogenes]